MRIVQGIFYFVLMILAFLAFVSILGLYGCGGSMPMAGALAGGGLRGLQAPSLGFAQASPQVCHYWCDSRDCYSFCR